MLGKLLFIVFLLASSVTCQNEDNISGDYDESTVVPLPARCIPEPKVILFKSDEDLSLQYFPSCTRVDRCSGCCTLGELFSCQPTEIQILNMRVIIYRYAGGNQLIPVGKKIFKVENHLKCECDCIVKEKDCNTLQKYVKQQCKCMCINDDEKEKCLQADSKMFWDSNSCSCQCLNVKDCTTGYVFNKHTCSCESEERQLPGHQNDFQEHQSD